MTSIAQNPPSNLNEGVQSGIFPLFYFSSRCRRKPLWNDLRSVASTNVANTSADAKRVSPRLHSCAKEPQTLLSSDRSQRFSGLDGLTLKIRFSGVRAITGRNIGCSFISYYCAKLKNPSQIRKQAMPRE